MTARGLAAKTGMGEWEADTLMRKYFDTFPGVATMMARDRAMASAEWYVKSVTGRVIWVNLYNRAWSNFAANYPIQTTGADIMKRAMVLLAERFEAEGMRHTMRIQVHDELVVEAPAGMTAKIRKMAQAASKQAAHEICPGLPFPVEIHSGYTWACKQEDK
jgi:DNA polymerase-1